MPSERIEDYLEAIFHVCDENGYAKVTDISKALKVRPPSVTEMFKRLADKGYIRYEKYSGVTLTEAGLTLAREVEKRHNTLKEFLLILGVEETIADQDACRIEHDVNPETMERLTKFVELVNSMDNVPNFIVNFKKF